MEECYRQTDTWKMKPRRMLQHKTAIQCARYAFGLSGIIDEDEAKSYEDAGVINMGEKSVNDEPTLADKFNADDIVDTETGEITEEVDTADLQAKMELSESVKQLNDLLPELSAVPEGQARETLRTLYKTKMQEFKS